MTGRIEKTVFISYRRTNYWTALAVYQNLTAHGFDVFIDYQNIRSGDFEQVILDNIKARAHFLVILSSSALERCNESTDLMRREIEMALDKERNIVPLMMEGFDFGSSTVAQILTGKLASLRRKNGLRIVPDYFNEAMKRLRKEYLNLALEDVRLYPLSAETTNATESEKVAANEAAPVKAVNLTAEEWFERGYAFQNDKNFDEAIRCYTEATRLGIDNANLAMTYNNRGAAHRDNHDLQGALYDLNEAIHLKSDLAIAYHNRGLARFDNYDFQGGLADFDKVVSLEPDNAEAYNDRGVARRENNDLLGALADYDKAIHLKADFANVYNNRGNARSDNRDWQGALADYEKAISIEPDDAKAYYNRGNFCLANHDWQGALADYDKAISLQPNLVESYNKRGIARRENNDLQGALADCDEVIRHKPNDPDPFYNRALIWEMKKDYSSAIADYQKYLDLSSEIQDGDQKEVQEKIKILKSKLTKKKSVRKKPK